MAASPAEGHNQTMRNGDRPQVPLFQRGRVRAGLVAATGLYLFLVCAAYFGRHVETPGLSVVVLGPQVVEPGGTFPLRLAAYRHEDRTQVGLRVTGATLIDAADRRHPLTIPDAEAAKPTQVHLGPAPQQPGPFRTELVLESADGLTRTITVGLQVFRPGAVELPAPTPVGEQGPSAGESLVVDLLSEGAGLPMDVSGRVWFRVTDGAGHPVSGARVRWTAHGAEPGSGDAETDPGGLASATLVPNGQTTDISFEITAEREGRRGTRSTRVHPLGRGIQLRLDRMLMAPGEPPIKVQVHRSDRAEPAYCDLYRGDAWVRSWVLPAGGADRGAEGFDLTLDVPQPHRLQCYSHFASPGVGYDAAWVLGSPLPRHKAIAALLRQGSRSAGSRDRAFRAHVPVVDDAGEDAIAAAFRTQELYVTDPPLLYSTRATDVRTAEISNARARGHFLLLIGASFGLIILWAVYVAIHSAIENRTRLSLALADLGDLAVPAAPPTRLKQARASIQVIFVVLVLVLNVIAMLALFQHI